MELTRDRVQWRALVVLLVLSLRVLMTPCVHFEISFISYRLKGKLT